MGIDRAIVRDEELLVYNTPREEMPSNGLTVYREKEMLE